jgi:hypothetical protein
MVGPAHANTPVVSQTQPSRIRASRPVQVICTYLFGCPNHPIKSYIWYTVNLEDVRCDWCNRRLSNPLVGAEFPMLNKDSCHHCLCLS